MNTSSVARDRIDRRYGGVFYLLVKYTLHCTVCPAIRRITQNSAPVRRVIIIVNIMSLRRSRPQVRTSSTKIFSAYSHEQQMTIVSPKRNLRKAMPAFFPVTIKIARITTLSPVHPFLIWELRAYIFWQIDKIVSSKVDMVHVCTKSLGRENLRGTMPTFYIKLI